ncbi:maleylpyruvate isomerase family mycothiol-dependent enzyme [Gordonia sp. 'Campus']|uniref:maleylpyruvate isomerase family mycothiol-dependent enzyme n=1 Tax=Gordonia sp. 'Campus' TaxID=2915824 RepID=UPI001EE3E602|nr:maleylpyruvate isomerase family mycothiol-dependent enzyme [Gordonia sp. 'Campus']
MDDSSLSQTIADFRSGADHFVRLVDMIDDNRWDGPGLGDWSLRSLVGHTGRSLTTVVTYLAESASTIDLDSTAAYYASIQGYGDPASVLQRGVDAGLALGDDPRSSVKALRARALDELDGVDDRPLATPFGGIMLSHYLPTRTFELAVHGLDISRAIGADVALPASVLASALSTAAATAARTGQGEQALLTLTGRSSEPISVV